MTADAAVRSAKPVERRILIVDDEKSVRDSMQRYFCARGFEVEAVDSAAAALAALHRASFAAAIFDVRMPGTTGIDLVPAALTVDPNLAILMLSGVNDAAAATEALSAGAVDYLLKPIALDRIEDALVRALARRDDRVASTDSGYTPRRSPGIVDSEGLDFAGALRLLEGVVNEMELRSPYRTGNSSRVADLATAVAQSLGFDAASVRLVQAAARVHDVGNVAVADAVLDKATSLTPGEHAAMRRHVQVGLELIGRVDALAPILPLVADHHERWAGGGYPADLRGQDISPGGRILSVADAFVAVTAGRPYFAALAAAPALAYLAPHSGTHFDPNTFRALERVVRARGV